MHGAKSFYSGFHDFVAISDRVIVRYCLSASTTNFFDDYVSRPRIRTLTFGRTAEVVNNDFE